MGNQFTVKYPGDKSQLISKIRSAVGNKGKLDGNEQKGSFEGSTPVGDFEGSYVINGNDITVTISKKPFLVSHGRIQEEFEKALKNV
ncbi:hypothetical protein ACLI1A_04775 [Flavobacterium sp. RHBU_3]|uniref:hypothetical protein n=1 Tax=Flavobacterium sp. RHBU_3 TaxID=3391184 RepID=UPI0039848ED0